MLLFSTIFVSSLRFKLTGDEPAEEKERSQRVPGRAESAEGVRGAVFGLLGAGQTGEHRQDQAKYSQHYQIDGNVVLPRTVIQVYCTCWTQVDDNLMRLSLLVTEHFHKIQEFI